MTLLDYFVRNLQLEKEWAVNPKIPYPENLASRTRTKVWWRCDNGHEWQATLNSRVYLKRGCPDCANQPIITGENDLATMDPPIVRLWHPSKNGNLKPSDITSGSKKRIWWLCDKGHEWQTRVDSIKAGTSCPYCYGRYPIQGETDLATTHPHIVQMWSDRNKYLPSQISAGSHKRIWLVCPQKHVWETRVDTVAIDGTGCPYCSGRRAIPGETDLATMRPDLMEQWDFGKNTISPYDTSVASHDKAWWKCDLGHSYCTAIFSRTRENGTDCPYCSGRMVMSGFNDVATLKPKLAEQWYQPLNGNLTPQMVTLGSNKRVWWQCGDGHVWQAYIYARAKKNGTGCPVCSGKVKLPIQKEISNRSHKESPWKQTPVSQGQNHSG